MRLTHIGGPTVLIELDGLRLLTDPTFDPPGRSYRFGWGTGSRKLAGPAILAAELGRIDAVLLTHDHHDDNLDAAGRALLRSAAVVVTTTAGARRLGESRGLAPWQATRIEVPGGGALEVTATPCRHGPRFSRPIVGDVVGFALRRPGADRVTLWISGDTVLYDGVRAVADHFAVDVALLHVGGVRFPVTGPLRYTMTGREAVALCEVLRPRVAIPVHYEGWSHFREGRDVVERAFAAAPDGVRASVRWLPIGEAVEIEREPAQRAGA